MASVGQDPSNYSEIILQINLEIWGVNIFVRGKDGQIGGLRESFKSIDSAQMDIGGQEFGVGLL